MSWTVWQRRSRCENCGAKIPIPPEGLYVTCEYCGTKAPVPDMEARRQAMERQAQDSRQAQGHARGARERAAAPPAKKGHGLAIILILFVVVLIGLGTCIPGLVISMLTRTGMAFLVKASQEQAETTKASKAAEGAQQNRAAEQAAPTTRKKKPRRPRRQRPARQVEPPSPRPGPDRQLNPPPRTAAPLGAGPGFEVPETDLDRALEDDDL